MNKLVLSGTARTCVWERERYKDKTEREKAHIQEHTEKRKRDNIVQRDRETERAILVEDCCWIFAFHLLVVALE